jgi:hypothetical protein
VACAVPGAACLTPAEAVSKGTLAAE